MRRRSVAMDPYRADPVRGVVETKSNIDGPMKTTSMDSLAISPAT